VHACLNTGSPAKKNPNKKASVRVNGLEFSVSCNSISGTHKINVSSYY